MKDVFEKDEVRDVLEARFYRPKALTPKDARESQGEPVPVKKKKRAKKPKPDHYEVICISMYKEDLAALDRAVEKLKARGHRKMSRSALIRFALDTMDVDALPKSY